MSRPLPAGLSAAQRAFVDAARSMGALAPDRAQPLTALPRLSGRELDALVAQGLVREAASWTYYVFESSAPAAPAPSPWPVVPPRRRAMGVVVRLIFWVALLLVPMLAILLLSASALPAQVSELTVGTRVRVRAPDAVAGRLTGVIVGQGGDSLVVTRPNALPITLRLQHLTQLDVSRGRSHARGAMKGAFWGGGIMAVFGVLFVDGATTCDGPPTNITCDETTLLESAAYGAVSGVLVGATIGAFVGSEHWERIALPRVAIGPRRDGAVHVGLAWRW